MEHLITFSITLFFIMDPLGNIPAFLHELRKVPKESQKKVLIRELSIALIVLLFFFFTGKYFIDMLNLSQEAISLGGGIVLFLIGLHMIFPTEEYKSEEYQYSEPFIVPLAIPLVAGPSSLAVILVLNNPNSTAIFTNLMAIIIAWAATSIILLFAPILLKLLKEKGLVALERLMGMILIIMSIQMILDGIKDFLSRTLG